MSLLDPLYAALDYILPTPTPEEEAAARLEDHLRQGAVIVVPTPSEYDLNELRVAMQDPTQAKWEWSPDLEPVHPIPVGECYLSPRAVEAAEKAFGKVDVKKKDPGE